MATLAKIATNEKRKKLSKKYAAKRAELKAIVVNRKASDADKLKAGIALNKLPRNSLTSSKILHSANKWINPGGQEIVFLLFVLDLKRLSRILFGSWQ